MRRRLRLLDVVVDLVWDGEELTPVARALFADAEPGPADDAGADALRIDLTRHDRAEPLADLFQRVERQVTEQLLRRASRRWWMLHAGAVAVDGRGLLLAGPPDAGKTSLACALARSGAALLSDEVAPVDPADGRVHPFPRDVILHRGTRDALPGLPPSPGFQCFPGYRYLPPSAVGGAPVAGPVPVAGLLLPRRQAGVAARLEPIGPAEAARVLLEQCFDLERVGAGRAVDCAARLATAPAARVIYDGACAAARCLRPWLSQIEVAVVR